MQRERISPAAMSQAAQTPLAMLAGSASALSGLPSAPSQSRPAHVPMSAPRGGRAFASHRSNNGSILQSSAFHQVAGSISMVATPTSAAPRPPSSQDAVGPRKDLGLAAAKTTWSDLGPRSASVASISSFLTPPQSGGTACGAGQAVAGSFSASQQAALNGGGQGDMAQPTSGHSASLTGTLHAMESIKTIVLEMKQEIHKISTMLMESTITRTDAATRPSALSPPSGASALASPAPVADEPGLATKRKRTDEDEHRERKRMDGDEHRERKRRCRRRTAALAAVDQQAPVVPRTKTCLCTDSKKRRDERWAACCICDCWYHVPCCRVEPSPSGLAWRCDACLARQAPASPARNDEDPHIAALRRNIELTIRQAKLQHART